VRAARDYSTVTSELILVEKNWHARTIAWGTGAGARRLTGREARRGGGEGEKAPGNIFDWYRGTNAGLPIESLKNAQLGLVQSRRITSTRILAPSTEYEKTDRSCSTVQEHPPIYALPVKVENDQRPGSVSAVYLIASIPIITDYSPSRRQCGGALRSFIQDISPTVKADRSFFKQ